jgi:RNA polymerase sigma-70 factor (ECF subfamily)
MEQLVRAAQRGDTGAMNALVVELSPYLARICGSIALDEGDDALQETMIAVLKNIRSLREPAALWGWARRIAVREAVRLASRRQPWQSNLDLQNEPGSTPDLDETMDVAAVLRSLPAHQRAILVLRDLEGLSEAEAARLLNVPQGTAKSRLHRAREAFRMRWET